MNYPQQSYQATETFPQQSNGGVGGNQAPDIVAMLWRWKWLPVLGAFLGAIIGLFVWVQSPPQFIALARIQVVTPGGSNIPMVNLDWQDGAVIGRTDDVVIMKSHVVIRNAIEIGRLSSNPKLSDKSPEELIDWVRDTDRLSVRPGTKETATNIVDVTFRCDDAELSAEVVSAIVLGYEKFISKESSALSTDVLNKLAKFRDEYDTRSKKAQEEYLRIRDRYPLIGIGNEMRDPYTEALLRANEALSVSVTKSTKILSILDSVERSKGDKVDSLLAMIGRQINDSSLLQRANPLTEMIQEDSFLKTGAQSFSQRLEMEQLAPAQMKLEQHRNSYGDQHPLVLPLLKQVEMLKENIAELRAQEEAERLKAQERLQENKADPISPEQRLAIIVGSLQEEVKVLLGEQKVLQETARENESKSKEMNYAIAQLEVVRNEMNTIRESAEELRSALEKLSFGTGYGSKVMKRLEVQSTGAPAGPFLVKYLGISAFLGACLFSGLAYLLELADRSYRSPDEIARDLGVPILGHLQMTTLTRKDRKDDNLDLSLVAFHKAKSTASEAYRGVRTAIYFGNQAGNIKVIQVTSPVPGDGKSTVAANLAISIAQSGRRTLLLDCDMRRPRLAKLIGVRDDIGLTNVLSGKLELDQAIQTTCVPNLEVLTCGRRPGNPAELLLSDDFVDVINSLREKFDYIIMDTPPILAVSDPANASACADGVILTLRLRRNLRPLAIRAAQMLQSVNAQLLGVAINGVTGRAGYGYGGYRYDGARAANGYGGYGGYGYGATYGYGDYYTSSAAESISSRVVKAPAGASASSNGRHANGNGASLSGDDTSA